VEYNAAAALGELPRGLTAGQARTDNVNRPNVMNRHALRIAPRPLAYRHPFRLNTFSFLALWLALASCARSREPGDPNALSAQETWVQNGCKAEVFDPTGWPKYRLAGFEISVPPPYRAETAVADAFTVRTPFGYLGARRDRNAKYDFESRAFRVRSRQASCFHRYGGFDVEVISSFENGNYSTSILAPPAWTGSDSDKWMIASVSSRSLAEATVLRHALRTMVPVRDTVGER
jgi:hypothetical protein